MACAYCRQTGHNSSTCQNPNGTALVSPGTSGQYTITTAGTGTNVSAGDRTIARFRVDRDGALTPVEISDWADRFI